MRWSGLNAAQRAYLANGARFNKDEIVNGKVARLGAAKSVKAEMIETARALDRDAQRAKKSQGRALMAAALAAFTPSEIERLATKLPAGRAQNAGALTQVRAGAMPMNFYRGTAFGC
jgi:hypothetical protein